MVQQQQYDQSAMQQQQQYDQSGMQQQYDQSAMQQQGGWFNQGPQAVAYGAAAGGVYADYQGGGFGAQPGNGMDAGYTQQQPMQQTSQPVSSRRPKIATLSAANSEAHTKGQQL